MYNKIMVPLDGSELAECVLPHVDAFTSECQAKTIVFVRVVEPVTSNIAGDYAISMEEFEKRETERQTVAMNYIEYVAGRVKKNGATLKTEVLMGRVADSLADYAEKHDFDLILIATHGRSGISRWVRGSVADRVLHAATVPVLMVRAEGCLPES